MKDEKTTKEILREKTVPKEHIPLYSPEALQKVGKEFDGRIQ